MHYYDHVRMCLHIDSLKNHREQVGTMPLSGEDFAHAETVFRKGWSQRDRSVRYCMNPLIVAAELVRLSGGNAYPEIRRFKGEKGLGYDVAIRSLLDATQQAYYHANVQNTMPLQNEM